MHYKKMFSIDLSHVKKEKKDKLIELQVKLINKKLKEMPGISVTKLLKKELKLNKNTIVTRFTKAGYRYNEITREYIKNEDIQNDNKCKSIIEISNERAITKENSEVDIILPKDFINEIKELVDAKEDIFNVIQMYNRSKNIIDVEFNKLEIDRSKFEGDLKGRMVRVYNNINDEWVVFCDSYKEYTMQDLYSQALLEFMKKYKK